MASSRSQLIIPGRVQNREGKQLKAVGLTDELLEQLAKKNLNSEKLSLIKMREKLTFLAI